ncbi:hypothetical protein BJ944DRAFT_179025, partial [Cunninghamella echinulata]
MDYYEADTEDGLEDQLETSDRLLDYQHPDQQQIRQQQQPVSTRDISNNNAMEYTYDNLDNENDGDSDYSLDYEYLGPRHPVYRDRDDADSIASELSDTINDNNTAQQQQQHQQQPYFDMWDEDPYSTNDFTWESNDMRLTYFIKKKQRRLLHLDSLASWNNDKPPSFWRKEKGWPKQLPCSSTTTNHDQSANALCLVPTNYASSDKLYGIYRDRIIECGRPWATSVNKNKKNINASNRHSKHTTTWIDSESTPTHTHTFPFHPKDNFQEIPTPSSSKPPQYSSPSSSSSEGLAANVNQCISKFIPYTKYIKRSEFTPPSGYQNAYVGLGFEPLCLEHKYGYMAIGGLEGEFELYCCMNKDQPFKIWGTKFKGKDNIISDLYNQVMVPYSSQHVVWNHSSEYFAHTSDTHYRVLVWRASTHDILYSIDTAGYTYGIKFHPYLDGVLAFANRYGYFHTVDLTQALDITTLTTNEKNRPATTTSSTDYCNIYDFDKQTTKVREHICNAYCINTSIEGEEEGEGRGMDHHYSAYHTQHLKARHEMTMVAFRGEKDRRLRILAKINGIQWSQDGRYLYVATKKRVLAYEFIPSQHHQHHRVSSLFGLAGQTIRQMLELQYEYLQQKKRKKSKKNNNQLDIRQKRQRLQQDDNDNSNGLVNTATTT